MQDIHLFINDKEVEFSKDPSILFNYKVTDVSNPTAVKNSYTKSITVQGTPSNNDIFSNIWKLDSYYDGTTFNPISKASFKLFVNGDLVEKGYAKLDSVLEKNNAVEYTITLYGGLGSFFWNLSYNGENQMNLYDLDFGINDIDFVINKEMVWDAWSQLMKKGTAVYTEDEVNRPSNYLYADRWNLINFTPAYNGTPSELDGAKVLINRKGLDTSLFENPAEGYSYLGNYFLGEVGDAMTEWEVRDIRSYLQRPVVNVKKIIEACCEPQNNGGYEVDLDSHFFNSNNPYWQNAWCTLPMLSEMSLEAGETETISNCTLTNITRSRFGLVYATPSLSKYSNLEFEVRPKFNLASGASTSADTLYGHTSYSSTGGITLQDDFVKKYEENSGCLIQLHAFDANSNVVAVSNAYVLCSAKSLQNGSADIGARYDAQGAEKQYIIGDWKKDTDGQYYFADKNGNFKTIKFYLTNNVTFDHLELYMETPEQQYIKYYLGGNRSQDIQNYTLVDLYEIDELHSTTWRRLDTVQSLLGRVRGNYSFDVISFSVQGTDYEKFISNSRVSKDRILATDHTPCDYLLSYCKMFGLYFWTDPAEESDNTDRYPSGVIHICDRNTFYRRNDIMNIEKLIDRSKNLQITPQTAKSKYYRFATEMTESEAGVEYSNTYGKEYGEQLVNTNYEFDASKTELYDGNVFKGGVMVTEKDRYFNDTPSLPSYAYNGFTYSYFKQGDNGYDTDEHEMAVKKYDSSPINAEGYDYLDCFAKLQCHSADNSNADGSGVLLFYHYPIETRSRTGLVNYWLTDDVREMAVANGDTPCWIMTMDERTLSGGQLAYRITNLPYFSREIVSNYNIVHSWDFSGSHMTYVPDAYNTSNMGIYEKCWKDYINDLYSANARKLTCYVKLLEKPSIDWLRRFYWFDGALWRLNAITDWNVASYGTTKMEFIKVQDISNYALGSIVYDGDFYCIPSTTIVGINGGDITVTVYKQNGGRWYVEPDGGVLRATDGTNNYTWPIQDVCSPTQGSGTRTNITLSIPANTTGKVLTYTLGICDDNDNWVSCVWTQDTDNYINVSTTSVKLDYETGMNKTIQITSNLDNYNIEINDNS